MKQNYAENQTYAEASQGSRYQHVHRTVRCALANVAGKSRILGRATGGSTRSTNHLGLSVGTGTLCPIIQSNAENCRSLESQGSDSHAGQITARRGQSDIFVLILLGFIIGSLLTAIATSHKELKVIHRLLLEIQQQHSIPSPTSATQESPSESEEPLPVFGEPLSGLHVPLFPVSIVPDVQCDWLPSVSQASDSGLPLVLEIVDLWRSVADSTFHLCSYTENIDSFSTKNRQFSEKFKKFSNFSTLEFPESNGFSGIILEKLLFFYNSPIDRNYYLFIIAPVNRAGYPNQPRSRFVARTVDTLQKRQAAFCMNL